MIVCEMLPQEAGTFARNDDDDDDDDADDDDDDDDVGCIENLDLEIRLRK